MNCPRAAIFDLDDTLAESFKSPEPAMTEKLKRLLQHIPVAIMTGRDFERIESGFLADMATAEHIDRFFLFPESTSQCLQWSEAGWIELYTSSLSGTDRMKIREGIEKSVAETNVLDGLPCFGERLLEKRAQTAFAMLGIQVPTDLKYSWDPGNTKRKTLQEAMVKNLPDFEVLLGGATSIDVTNKGMDKSFGVEWLSKRLDIPASEMFYVGDALYEGGNDNTVIPTGIQTRAVSGPPETARILDELLTSCSA